MSLEQSMRQALVGVIGHSVDDPEIVDTARICAGVVLHDYAEAFDGPTADEWQAWLNEAHRQIDLLRETLKACVGVLAERGNADRLLGRAIHALKRTKNRF